MAPQESGRVIGEDAAAVGLIDAPVKDEQGLDIALLRTAPAQPAQSARGVPNGRALGARNGHQTLS